MWMIVPSLACVVVGAITVAFLHVHLLAELSGILLVLTLKIIIRAIVHRDSFDDRAC